MRKATPVLSNYAVASSLDEFLHKQIKVNGGFDYYDIENAIRYITAGYNAGQINITTGGTPPIDWFKESYSELNSVGLGNPGGWRVPEFGEGAPVGMRSSKFRS